MDKLILGVNRELFVGLTAVIITSMTLFLAVGTDSLKVDKEMTSEANSFVVDLSAQYDVTFSSVLGLVKCNCSLSKVDCKERFERAIGYIEAFDNNMIAIKVKSTLYFRNSEFFDRHSKQLARLNELVGGDRYESCESQKQEFDLQLSAVGSFLSDFVH